MTRRPVSSPEEILLDRLRSGDEAAFLELVGLYHSPLFSLARLLS